jgi:oligopeptide transport system substrate-binding protein
MAEAAAAGGDPAKRMQLLSEAEKILVDNVGNIPLLYYNFKNAVSSKLTGWDDNVMDVHPTRFIAKN